jgi:hypothetical protein
VRPSFRKVLDEIVKRVPGLPGLTVPHAQLIGAEPITGLGCSVRRLSQDTTIGPEIDHAGSLVCYPGGIAVISGPQGLVWKSNWDDIAVCVLDPGQPSPGKEAGPPRWGQLELGMTSGRHVLVEFGPLALFSHQAGASDRFFMHEVIREHFKETPPETALLMHRSQTG